MQKSENGKQGRIDSSKSNQSSAAPFPALGLRSQEDLEYRKQLRGMITVASKVPLTPPPPPPPPHTPPPPPPPPPTPPPPPPPPPPTPPPHPTPPPPPGSSAYSFGNI